MFHSLQGSFVSAILLNPKAMLCLYEFVEKGDVSQLAGQPCQRNLA